MGESEVVMVRVTGVQLLVSKWDGVIKSWLDD